MKRPPTEVQKFAWQLKEWANEKGLGIIDWEHVAQRAIENRRKDGSTSDRKEHRACPEGEGSSLRSE